MIEVSFTLWQAFLFLSGLGCIFLANFIFFMMIGMINRRLPDSEQVSYLFMYPGQLGKVLKLYKELYPTGFLHVIDISLIVLGFLLLIAGLSTLGSN